ncbi:hypothetical protein CDAR_182901 [Caerostris darwini]|uniref:Uncharacterized protein n=1 Tax=Caerostris darwini TaxID=1538125 RepID=A0AAV4T2X0_9ARAC|nr:hypothetical protein CDAR_182901 [Caerostris darwini]
MARLSTEVCVKKANGLFLGELGECKPCPSGMFVVCARRWGWGVKKKGMGMFCECERSLVRNKCFEKVRWAPMNGLMRIPDTAGSVGNFHLTDFFVGIFSDKYVTLAFVT